jgi:hypothetical protein
LIDQYQLIFCPVVLGSGTFLFRDDGDSFDVSLLNARSFDRGAALLSYTVSGVPAMR